MGTAFARWGVLVLRGGRLTVRMGYRRPSTIREKVLDYAISERLQELIELLLKMILILKEDCDTSSAMHKPIEEIQV